MKKRFLSILLTLCMLLSVLPVTPVFAAEEVKVLTGDMVSKLLCNGTAVNSSTLMVDVAENAESPGDFYNQNVEGYVLTNGAYKLGSDVTLDAPIIIHGGSETNPITLDLCGHVLKYENSSVRNSVIVVNSDAYFTLTDSASDIDNGYSYTAGPDAGDFTLYTLGMEGSGTTAITGGIITGGTGTAIDLGDGYYEYDGGGVFVGCRATFTMTGGSIVDCKVDGSIAYGGGVFVAGGRSGEDPMHTIFNMTGGSIIGCKTSCGGGVHVFRNSKFNMTDSRIIGCTANTSGGGIDTANNGSSGTYMKNSTISQCTGRVGGGVYNACNFVMENSSITGCIAELGGGVYVGYDRCTFLMKSGSTISGCVANAVYDTYGAFGSGGGVYITGASHVIIEDRSAISDCTAESDCGASVYVNEGYLDAKGGNVEGVAIAKHIIKNSSMTGSALFYDGVIEDKQVNGDIIGKLVSFMNGDRMYAQTVAGTTENQDGYTCGGGKITLPTLTRDGYHFTGWYKDSACTEKWDPNKTDGENDASFNVTGNYLDNYGTYTLYAGWTPITYTVTYEAGENGTGTVTPGSKTIRVDFTLSSETFTRTGYTQTGWAISDGGEKVYDLGGKYTTDADITLYPVWKANQYTITVKPTNGNKDITIKQDYGTTVTVPTLTRDGYAFDGWDKTFPTTMPAENMTITAKWKDVTAPTGEIKLGTNSWNAFLNNISFGLFFKDTQEVAITATDNSGEDVNIAYLLSDKELTAEELATATFTAYSDKFNVEPNNEYVIYAKLSDKTGNITYINSNGIVLDNVAPVISGIANGKTYCEVQTVTVSDKYDVTVTVNGTPITLDANGQLTLSPAEGTQKIVAKDQSGNVSAEMIVTVNDGHEGGTATCTKKAVCKHCSLEYGEIDNNNHDLEHNKENAATVTTTGNKEYWHCKDCKNNFSDKDGKNVIDLKDTVISKLAPEIIDGKGQSLTAGETRELTFRSNAAYSDFIRVEVDGKTVDGKNYTVKEGSTIVTLKADYVATLSAGEHTLGIVSESGTATTTFTVNAKVVNDNTSPATGDNSHMTLWFALLFVSGSLLTVTGVYGKKKKYSVK